MRFPLQGKPYEIVPWVIAETLRQTNTFLRVFWQLKYGYYMYQDRITQGEGALQTNAQKTSIWIRDLPKGFYAGFSAPFLKLLAPSLNIKKCVCKLNDIQRSSLFSTFKCIELRLCIAFLKVDPLLEKILWETPAQCV